LEVYLIGIIRRGSGKMEDLSYLGTEYAREKKIEEFNKPYKESGNAGNVERNKVGRETDVQRFDRCE
jgi:hypothetical protein